MNLNSASIDRIKPQFLQALLIFAAGFWVYAPALHGGWLWDDDFYFLRNPLLNDPGRWWKAWFEPGSFIEYYPLTQTVQWIEWQIWRQDTLGYHLVNVALHVTSALLFWRVLAKFGLPLAWLGGLLFVIYPAHVESVAWLSELKNTLSLPPFLLAMSAWIDYDSGRRRRDYFLSLGFFTVALLCKITMVTFPFVILLYAWWKRERLDRRDVFASLPFFAVALGLGWLSLHAGTTYAFGRTPLQEGLPQAGLLQRLDLAGLTLSFYFGTCVWPVDLMPLYPHGLLRAPSLLTFLPWAVLLAVVFWLWTRRRSWGRHALLGLGFFVILLAPFLGFVFASYMNFTWVMDHFLYIPSLGILGLEVAAMGQIYERLSFPMRGFAIAAALLLSVLAAAETHAYAGAFRSPEALWTYAVAKNPRSEVAHNNLAWVYLDQQRLTEAIVHYRAAIALKPDYAFAHNGLGNALLFSGDREGAAGEYRAALVSHPNYPEALNGLGNVLLQSGNLDEARMEVEQALQLSPHYVEAICNLGLIDARQGQVEEAIRQFEAAQKLRPSDPRIAQELDALRAQAR